MNQSLKPRAPEEKNARMNVSENHPGLNASELATQIEKNVVAVGTTGSAREVLAGLEGKIEEKDRSASERKSDPAAQQGVATKAATGQAGSAVSARQAQKPVPARTEVVQVVRRALQTEVKILEIQVRKFKKEALKFAHELAVAFQELRTLKRLLKDLLTLAADFLKLLYEKVLKKEALTTVEY